MYSNVTKGWSTTFSSIVSYQNILNISHMLYQLYYLIISFNLHNSFMKYLLFLSYDTCKIGLAYWSWPKVKGKVSGGTRTKRRPPDVGLITLGLNILCPSWFAVCLSPLICVLEADPGNQHFQVFCPWTPMGAAKQMRSEGRGEECEWKRLPAISANKACCAI